MDALTLLLCFLGFAITDNDIFGDDLIEQVGVTSSSHIHEIVNVHFQWKSLVLCILYFVWGGCLNCSVHEK